MRLNELKTNKNYTFTNLYCKVIQKTIDYNEEKDLKGKIELSHDQNFNFRFKHGILKLEIEDEQKEKLIKNLMKMNYSNLAYIEKIKNDTIFIDITFFYRVSRIGEVSVLLNNKVIESLIKKKFIYENGNYIKKISDNFILTDGNDTYFAFNTTDEKKSQFENEDNNNKQDLEYENNEIELDTQFKKIILYGKDYSFFIMLNDSEEYIEVKSVKYNKHNNLPCMRLGIGNIKFSTQKEYISNKVKNILANDAGYLDIWKKYSNMEGEFLLKRVREAGVFEYNQDKINIDGDYKIIQITGNKKRAFKYLKKDEYISISESIPEYIKNKSLTWKEYTEDKKNQNTLKAKIISCDEEGRLKIECDNLCPNNKYISLSIVGDEKQIERREKARRLIEQGQSPNPALGLIIAGNLDDYTSNSNIIKKELALSDFVKTKIFKKTPTQIQREAIEIALNTPDIAIIQGPPGTGKTTVITAIIERLNEMSNKQNLNPGDVLITSFQHDAVRNVIERLSINSLPTIKFGKQNDTDMTSEELVEKWSNDLVEKLKEKNPKFEETEQIKKLTELYHIYRVKLDSKSALEFLEYAKNENIDNDIDELINLSIEDENEKIDIKEDKIIAKIRRLRTTKEGFLDDGPDISYDLLEELKKIINKRNKENREILEILEKTSEMLDTNDVSNEDLEKLNKVKNILLDKCIPKPTYIIPKPKKNIIEIYNKVKNQLKGNFNEVENIIYELYNELVNNQKSVNDAISSYNFVYAATTQQSQGREIRDKKGLKHKYENPEYTTVVVDEAARVNPGDLMVPLSQAKQRIILVGDHRQLPHIYNEEIIEELKERENIESIDSVKETLFEYFMKNAKKLQSKDGILRNITLDAQYRMHPILGEFISHNFYEQYDEGFKSPLDESYFKQNIYKVPLVWVEINNKYGNLEKDGTSKKRQCEVEYIAKDIKKHLQSEEGKDLSYGVISFYSAQVKAVRKELERILGKELAKKVRVGSVDAFQGMEFDVIYLSIVRTEDKYNLPKLYSESQKLTEKDYSKIGQNVYGFLTSENRLCVALSRQKKLLIVVGNSDIFIGNGWSDIAENCVPAMQNLYRLCQEKGEIISEK